MAAVYHRAGFTVAVDGSFDPEAGERHLTAAGLGPVAVRVLLVPRLEVALEPNRARATKPFDTAALDVAIARIDCSLRDHPPPGGWTVVDNSDEDLESTVARVLGLLPEGSARPGPRRA